jgi:iron complex transport system substrate-binding protein
MLRRGLCGLGAVLSLLFFSLGLLAHARAEAAQPIRISDDRGRPQEFAESPRRIVSLLPPLTEFVCVLDACGRLVGTDRYSNWPAAVKSLPKLGGLDDVAFEAIVALRPDVVLSGTSSRVIDRLEELGIPVVALEAKTFADAHRMLIVLGMLLGTPSSGEQVWQNIDSQIKAAAAQVPQRYRGSRVYFEISDAPYAASASSFIGELLTRLGLANTVPAELGPFPHLNPEYVLRAQPDVVMTSARELAGMAGRPGWGTLMALRTAQTCGFSETENDTLMRSGPRLGEAADAIVACLKSLPQRSQGAVR